MIGKRGRQALVNVVWFVAVMLLLLPFYLREIAVAGSWMLPFQILSTLIALSFFILVMALATRRETGWQLFLTIFFAVSYFPLLILSLWDHLWALILGLAIALVRMTMLLPKVGTAIRKAYDHFINSVREISRSLPE